jgi:hypothetical protein
MDLEHGQINFNENMIKCSDSDFYMYTDFGQLSECDPCDLNNYKFTKLDIVEGLKSLLSCDSSYLSSLIVENFGFSLSRCTKLDLLDFLDQQLYCNSSKINFYTINFKPLFDVVEVVGYSQGDRASVIVPNTMRDIGELRDYFTNLFYSSPVYCKLLIDGSELFLDEGLADLYDYDKKLIMDYANKSIDHKYKNIIINWLDEYLSNSVPEYS